MSEESKERQRQRYLRQQRHLISHEENKRRKAEKRARPQRREQHEHDDEATFEKMHRRHVDSGPSTHAPRTMPNRAELQGTVTWIGRGRIRVLVLGEEQPALLADDLARRQRSAVAIGDEVELHERDGAEPLVVAVLPRRSELARADGEHGERHVLAANVDVVVLVLAASRLRAGLIDRLRLSTAGSGAQLLVVVNKSDLPHDEDERERALAPHRQAGVAVLVTSALTGVGMAELRAAIAGRCAAFVGHSGVGKSTLLNALHPAGGRDTGAVREHDDRGRHTTTASSLVPLDDGTRLVDTPGVRMFGLVADANDAAAAFAEIVELGQGCRFRDCRHLHEPGCAVRAAVDAGTLEQDRYNAYRRLAEERQ